MRARRFIVWMCSAALACGAFGGGPRGALAQDADIRVVLDGRRLPLDVAPIERGGRVLVPLRGLFENLGARVQYRAAERAIRVSRGATTIGLVIGQRTATIGARRVPLDVPPFEIRGRTMVPLRFVGEALGAVVTWNARDRVVHVANTAPGVGTAPAPTLTPPAGARPAPVSPARIEGVLLRVDVGQGRLTVEEAGVPITLIVAASVTLARFDADSRQGGDVSLEDLRPGDAVDVRVDERRRATDVRATFRVARGRIESVSGRTITLDDGAAHRVSANAGVTLDGRDANLDDLRRGMPVQIRINPRDNEAWAVDARRLAAATPAPLPSAAPVPLPVPIPVPVPVPGTPRRPSVSWLDHDAAGPLRAGQVLRVRVTGTPASRVTFSIEGGVRGVSLSEGRRGEYAGGYVVRAGDDVRDAAVTVRLARGGSVVEATAARHVTIDTRPPSILETRPSDGEHASSPRPTIEVAVDDRDGSGIAEWRLWIRGREVTDAARRAGRVIRYTPAADLPSGRTEAEVWVSDRAGNELRARWAFLAPEGSPIRSIGVQPTSVHVAYQLVNVVVDGETGARVAFVIEGLPGSVAMTETSPGRYVGAYTALPGQSVLNAVVVVTFTRAGGQTVRAAAPTRVTIQIPAATPSPSPSPSPRPTPTPTVTPSPSPSPSPSPRPTPTPTVTPSPSPSPSPSPAGDSTAITLPTPGAQIRGALRIEGRARPNQALRVTVTCVVASAGCPPTDLQVRADARGLWALTLSLPDTARGRVRISAIALLDGGRESPPAVVDVDLVR